MAINDYTRVENPWNVKELVEAINNPKNSKHGKLTIPKFQRGVVWKRERRQEFIDSLKNGFPFGSLLLSENESKDEYKLIDGLQRTKTILEYSERGTKYISDDEIRQREDVLRKIMDTINTLSEEKSDLLVQYMGDWIRDQKNFDSDSFTGFEMAQEILGRFKILTLKSAQDLAPVLQKFISELKSESDISQVDIPIIIYTGPNEYLPKIFENINSKGTALNKYEIHAAVWSSYELKIDNEKIRKRIRDKYDAWIEEGLEVDGYDDDISPKDFRQRKFSIFEYIFGLSKYIATNKPEYKLLFRKPKDDAGVDPIGFNLCAACLGIELKKMGPELPGKLNKRLVLGQEKFETALFDVIDFIYDALERFIKPEFNIKKSGRGPKRKKARIYHSDYQIIDMISTVFRKKYDDQLNVRDSWPEIEKTLKKNIPFHYLYDLLNRRWIGVKTLGSSNFEREISKEAWISLLDQWFEDNHLKRLDEKRSSLRPADYLFFNYIYSHLMTYSDAHSPTEEFEFDHIISVKTLQELATKTNNQGVPINAIANFGLIDKDLNRDKRDLTIYQYYDKQKVRLY